MSWPAAVQTLKASFFFLHFFFCPEKQKNKTKHKTPKQENKQKSPKNHILKMAGLL